MLTIWLTATGYGLSCQYGLVWGPYGVGKRISLPYTRAIIKAVLDGSLADVDCFIDPVFGLRVPKSCPGVPPEILDPRNTWEDKNAYDQKARELAAAFHKNFDRNSSVSDEVKAGGPPVQS